MPAPNEISAVNAVKQIGEGRLSSVELVTACLARIETTDGEVNAWTHLNKEAALARAEELDTIRKAGRPVGALHGVPVGIKDIIDQKDIPTECGSPIFKGDIAKANATLVNRLIEEGAIILGKTVTTEMAFMNPSDTHNPHNVSHTPGGSSSGSAAAVAAFQVPLSIGTQTNGSVIRPASYCGVFGLKPSSGVISRTGILQTSKTLDQVGVFARSLEDCALLCDVLSGYDPLDDGSTSHPKPKFQHGYHQQVPVEPALVYFELPYADRVSKDATEGIEEFLTFFEGCVEKIPAPTAFQDVIAAHRKIHLYEYNQHLGSKIDKNEELISDVLKPLIGEAKKISPSEYEDALTLREGAIKYFATFFNDFDAIIAPSALGEAPKLEEGTGDPIASTIWTAAGLPCLSMPFLVGENNLPIGVQLIGSHQGDDRLMRTANWMLNELDSNEGETV